MVQTSPEMGSKVKVGSQVDLILSTGKVTVPDVTGSSLDDAKAKLEADDLGLKVQYTYEESSEAVDTVLEQSSGPNEDVEQGSTIQLTIARAAASSSPSPDESDESSESPSESPSPSAKED